jgi:chemotaxis methyl-accepting protein methylase
MFNVQEYLDYLERAESVQEQVLFTDAMTTNKTIFFREAEHFNYLRDYVLPELKSRRLRFWSAASLSAIPRALRQLATNSGICGRRRIENSHG